MIFDDTDGTQLTNPPAREARVLMVDNSQVSTTTNSSVMAISDMASTGVGYFNSETWKKRGEFIRRWGDAIGKRKTPSGKRQKSKYTRKRKERR